ncbi:MAG: hypothetical protein [Lokiarchaeia virus VerdaV1]|uniref:Uncharacterized protein n=1 Tax=Lokiarchaeia virus VerdaV1 TaxID=3070170 RepID=A0AA35CNN5_9CAUD|nr:MAG: hypothetical protein QIT41_gp28 [Lokiarchaeia virus VerdaV1]BDI54877.1 MAG: hypothetical protein [Lokiarchaeia virus VerdaV1]
MVTYKASLGIKGTRLVIEEEDICNQCIFRENCKILKKNRVIRTVLACVSFKLDPILTILEGLDLDIVEAKSDE